MGHIVVLFLIALVILTMIVVAIVRYVTKTVVGNIQVPRSSERTLESRIAAEDREEVETRRAELQQERARLEAERRQLRTQIQDTLNQNPIGVTGSVNAREVERLRSMQGPMQALDQAMTSMGDVVNRAFGRFSTPEQRTEVRIERRVETTGARGAPGAPRPGVVGATGISGTVGVPGTPTGANGPNSPPEQPKVKRKSRYERDPVI
jgi:Na+-transporting methylmalonyl-CoA/oxaloacetate decarboxylase gamma subunit